MFEHNRNSQNNVKYKPKYNIKKTFLERPLSNEREVLIN
jgi:hypothetical protein